MFNKQFINLKPSNTLLMNEISNELLKEGKEIFKFELERAQFYNGKFDKLQVWVFDKEFLNSYWYKHNRTDSTALTIHGEEESKGETDDVEMATL